MPRPPHGGRGLPALPLERPIPLDIGRDGGETSPRDRRPHRSRDSPDPLPSHGYALPFAERSPATGRIFEAGNIGDPYGERTIRSGLRGEAQHEVL
jgi:hypothetical protein